MKSFPDHWPLLSRMEEARRQTQHQLDMIDRYIRRRMTALIPRLHPRRTSYRRGRPPEQGAFLERYRSNLAGVIAERQQEIDALSRKLARQDRAIAALRKLQAVPISVIKRKRPVSPWRGGMAD